MNDPSSPATAFGPSADLDRFQAALRRSPIATALLQDWIAGREGARNAPVRAVVRSTRAGAVPAGVIDRLAAADADEVAYRRVWLVHRGRIYSCADNWFVPARLGKEIAARLDDGATPFGIAVEPLGPTRETLASERLWTPAPGGSEGAGRVPALLLRHRALVRSGTGLPICEVDEVYTRNLVISTPGS